MNITFLIGNGFDVGMGLNTRYSDFYKTLDPKSNNIIEKDIINKLQSGNADGEQYWKDYELGLGKLLGQIETQEEIHRFKTDKKQLDLKIINYIKDQEEKYTQDHVEKNKQKFLENLKQFHTELKRQEQKKLQQRLANSQSLVFNFISFNYTTILDRYIDAANDTINGMNDGVRVTINMPLHIHGRQTDGFIVGLDNASQIKNDTLANDVYLNDFILKKI